jgi:Domain of unknown function (DUF6438)
MRRLLALALLPLMACASQQEATSRAGELSQTASDPVITLERTACFGGCPVYRIWVSAEGKVGYEGRAHVRRVGAASGEIPAQRVQSLLSEIERAGYFSFANRYTSAEPTCGRYSTDSPAAITTIRMDGTTKRIEHDYGCGSAPGALVVLEQRIDEVLNSGRWTGR